MFAKGDFSFVADDFKKNMLEDAWSAVEKVGAWDELRREDVPGEGGFMFSRHGIVGEISAALVDRVGHSGASFGWTMRQMESIAKRGWDAYVRAFVVEAMREKEDEKSKNYDLLRRVHSLENIITTQRIHIESLEKKLNLSPSFIQKPSAHWSTMVSASSSSSNICPCRREKGETTEGWCGVAGGGVPACDH